MSRFRGLQPWLVPYADYLEAVALYNGLRVQVTSVFRSNQRQAVLYERYKRGLSDLPAAPPGGSMHNHGLAFDLVVNGDYRGDAQKALGAFWQGMGGSWGGGVDPVHFSIRK